MRPEPGARRWWLTAVPGLAGLALLVLFAMAPFVQALAALVLIILPTQLIAWPLLQPRLGSAGAFAIAGGLSIGMVAIGGLVLNLLPWGIQAATWIAYLLVLVAIGVALGRRSTTRRPRLRMVRHELVLVGIGSGLMVTALIFARSFAGYPAESFTQLWVSPSAHAPTSSVDLAIQSEEAAATAYRLELWRNGAQMAAWDDIRLSAGQRWTRSVSVGAGRIEVMLFRTADPGKLYRHVTLQVGGPTPTPVASGA